jgi:hypothetical protein
MKENEFIVYHIVTRTKMSLGQIINFDKNQNNKFLCLERSKRGKTYYDKNLSSSRLE